MRLSDPTQLRWAFAVAFVPMIASQLFRLHAGDALQWVLLDYAGRIGSLVVFAAVPAARVVVFRRESLRMGLPLVVLCIVGLTAATLGFDRYISPAIDHLLPGTRLGTYPELTGSLRWADLILGVALVAIQEEIVFRRCARDVFSAVLGQGAAMVIATSVLFAAYHWWTGLGNVALAGVFGILAMIFYRRTGSLWPAMAAHFLVDFIAFW